MKCVPRSKGQTLPPDQLAADLSALPGWGVTEQGICKTFRFGDFERTMAFVNAVADVAREQDHHPDLQVGYDRCRVCYTTHSAGGVSENDLICAARVEQRWGGAGPAE